MTYIQTVWMSRAGSFCLLEKDNLIYFTCSYQMQTFPNDRQQITELNSIWSYSVHHIIFESKIVCYILTGSEFVPNLIIITQISNSIFHYVKIFQLLTSVGGRWWIAINFLGNRFKYSSHINFVLIMYAILLLDLFTHVSLSYFLTIRPLATLLN